MENKMPTPPPPPMADEWTDDEEFSTAPIPPLPPAIDDEDDDFFTPSAPMSSQPPTYDDSFGKDDSPKSASAPSNTSSFSSVPSTSKSLSSLPQSTYIASRATNFVCPYCMREICNGDLLYFCKKCKRTYTEAQAKSGGLGRVVKKQYYCCNESITGQRLCPNCVGIAPHTDPPRGIDDIRILPQEIYNAKNEFRFCLTGYSRSGKTQYITQLLEYISKKPIPGIDSTFFLDNETRTIKNLIRQKLFVNGSMARTPPGYLDPMLFDIKCGRQSYISVFYDIAGEDFAGMYESRATECIWSSKNVILIIDPTTLDGVKNHPKVKAVKGLNIAEFSDGEVADPLNSYLLFIKKKYQKWEKHLKKVNLAVVFSKMDLFYEDGDFPPILSSESNFFTDGRFNVGEADAVSKAMVNWLILKEGSILSGSLSSFPNVRLFGVSSGVGVYEDNEEKVRETKRLLDPYLWLLYQNRILR